MKSCVAMVKTAGSLIEYVGIGRGRVSAEVPIRSMLGDNAEMGVLAMVMTGPFGKRVWEARRMPAAEGRTVRGRGMEARIRER